VDYTQELTTLSVRTGHTGLEAGLELAHEQLEHLAYVEEEAFTLKDLVDKMESGGMDPCPIWTDIATLPLGPFYKRVDLVLSGCPISKVDRDDEGRGVWPHLCRLFDGAKPRMYFGEVGRRYITRELRQVLCDLEARGYQTAWGIFGQEDEVEKAYVLATDGSISLPHEIVEHEYSAVAEAWKLLTSELEVR